MQEVAVVEGLQAEIVELQVTGGIDRGGEAAEIEAREFRVKQCGGDAGPDVVVEIVAVAAGHLVVRRLVGTPGDGGERLAPDLVEQEAGADLRVGRLGLDQRAGGEDRRERELLLGDAVVEVALRLGEDRRGRHAVQPRAGFLDDGLEADDVERRDSAVGARHAERRRRRGGIDRGGASARALAGTFVAVEDVGAGDLVVLATHQGELDLILDVLDVERPAAVAASGQARDDSVGQRRDDVVHATRRDRGVPFDREEGLGQRDRDLGRIKRGVVAVAADDVDPTRVAWHGRGRGRARPGCRHSGLRGSAQGRRHRQGLGCWGRDRPDAVRCGAVKVAAPIRTIQGDPPEDDTRRGRPRDRHARWSGSCPLPSCDSGS